MPRNGSGTYNLPQPAFVAGTKIASSAMNSDLSDIAAALTQSFSADGQTPFTGVFKNAAANVSNPSYTFTSDTTTGLFLPAGGEVAVATGGALNVTFATAGDTWSVPQTFNEGVTLDGSLTINGTSFTLGAGVIPSWYAAFNVLIDVAMIIDGGGSVLSTGQKGQIHVPFPCTIQKWWVMADQSGSVSIDVLRANNAVPSSSIVGSGTKPNLSSSQFSSAAPSSWTATTLAQDDFIAFSVSSATTVQRVTVALTCLRTG